MACSQTLIENSCILTLAWAAQSAHSHGCHGAPSGDASGESQFTSVCPTDGEAAKQQPMSCGRAPRGPQKSPCTRAKHIQHTCAHRLATLKLNCRAQSAKHDWAGLPERRPQRAPMSLRMRELREGEKGEQLSFAGCDVTLLFVFCFLK